MEDIEQLLKMTFLEEASELLANTEHSFLELERSSGNPELIEGIFRLAHSLKGSAGACGFDQVAAFTHELESVLLKIKQGTLAVNSAVTGVLLRSNDHLRTMIDALKSDPDQTFEQTQLLEEIRTLLVANASSQADPDPAPVSKIQPPQQPSQFEIWDDAMPAAGQPAAAKPDPPAKAGTRDDQIRIKLSRLDSLMNDVGELVILQTVLGQNRHLIPSQFLQQTVAQLTKICRSIQDTAMGLRMVPVKPAMLKVQRVARDTSVELGKSVEVELQGQDTELDKTVLDLISDPLVHLVRNAVDHGLENPEDRELAGKPRSGRVLIKASQSRGHIVVEVSDDGRGLDADKLVSRAVQRGILKSTDTLSTKEAFALVFAPGFSTKDQVTGISGRGVGMDVVKTNIESLGGTVEIESIPGNGTTFRMILPLTLAIIDGLVVRAGRDRFVLPLTSVHEMVPVVAKDVSSVHGIHKVLSVRGDCLPLFALRSLMERKTEFNYSEQPQIALVVHSGDDRIAVVVDDVEERQQVVIKGAGEAAKGTRGINGAAILGDGRAALILDVLELASAAGVTKTKSLGAA